MITRTTLTIDDKVKKAAQSYCIENTIRGGLSGLVEILLRQHLEHPVTNEKSSVPKYLDYTYTDIKEKP